MAKLGDGVGIKIYQRQFVRGVVVKAGPQGPQGATGNFGNLWASDWDSGTSYLTNEIVRYNGTSWLAIAPSTNVTPVEGASWTVAALAGTNGTNGQGVPTGGSTSQILAKTSGTDYATAWVSPQTGGVLASTSYATGTSTVSSATLADFDATNLAVTFTAPASGAVIVRLTGLHGIASSANSFWGLRESTTTVASGRLAATNVPVNITLTMAFKITGLSAGSHTYKWAGSSGGAVSLTLSNSTTPSLIEVLAA